jgi:dinuclear metal center YbgI/SA1388 family protein
MPTVDLIVRQLDQFAPLVLAAEWDNVGLLLGDRAAEVRKVMTCLTVTPESAAEAVAEGAQLVVSHHPIFFRPVQRLTMATPEGQIILSLIRAGIAVYCPHTAFDNTRDGINDLLARRLNLSESRPLRVRPGLEIGGCPLEDRGTIPFVERRCKIVVFVPDSDLARVSDALFAAGAGNIGAYSQCSFRLAGTGTFFGSDEANPAVGQKGRREEVAEWRLEAVCPESLVDSVVIAMRKAHSYEEPAYDVYPLRPSPSPCGEGRWGRLSAPLTLEALAGQVKENLSASFVHMVGEAARPVSSVAIVCGAGGDYVADAARVQADVLLTGEARFHDCLAARAKGLALILPGHYVTERPGVEDLAHRLAGWFPDLKVWCSRKEADPVQPCRSP